MPAHVPRAHRQQGHWTRPLPPAPYGRLAWVYPDSYYNSKLGPQRAALKSGCLGALAWLEKIVDAMDADEVLLGAHAPPSPPSKREAEAALKQGMARLQKTGRNGKMKQKQAADARLLS